MPRPSKRKVLARKQAAFARLAKEKARVSKLLAAESSGGTKGTAEQHVTTQQHVRDTVLSGPANIVHQEKEHGSANQPNVASFLDASSELKARQHEVDHNLIL